jgi:hypothetical protein
MSNNNSAAPLQLPYSQFSHLVLQVTFDVLVWPELVWNMKEKGMYGIKLTALHVFLH